MNELALITEAKNGVTSSFTKLVALHHVSLFHFLLARCQNKQDAEDVLQDTFISAYKYINSYKEKWQFNTWLFTIAKRLIKKQSLYYNKHDDIADVNISKKLSDEKQQISDDNIWFHIKKIVSEDAYDSLWLFYVEHMSIKEIAIILNKSQSWVKISLFRSKRKLSDHPVIKNLSEDYI